jgi:predicted protein tyrosine phosphatase
MSATTRALRDEDAALCDFLVPGLYVGPFLYAKSARWLQRHGVTHVLNATKSAPCLHEGQCTYMRVAIDDKATESIDAHFEACRSFIASAISSGGSVLVHCQMGRSRSAVLCAAFLMAEHQYDWRSALQCVQRARPSAAPNVGFLRQLKRYEPSTQTAPAPNLAQCTCHEFSALRTLRCTVCDPTDTPSHGGAVALNASSLAHAERFNAFVEMLFAHPPPEEVAFVPGPLHAGLFDGDDAASGVRTVPLPPLEVGMIMASRRLAIDLAALPALLVECHAAWRETRELFRVACGGTKCDDGCYGALDRATRAVLVLTLGQNYTAWADRRRRLLRLSECGSNVRAAASSEMQYSELVLQSFPKSHESFSHRRWLFDFYVRVGLEQPSWFLETQSQHEGALCGVAMQKRKANYHAARHMVEGCIHRLVSSLGARPGVEAGKRDAAACEALQAELRRTRAAAACAPSDPSIFHVRRGALAAALRAPRMFDGPASDLLREELRWTTDHIRRAPWHEVPWHHLRWVTYEARRVCGASEGRNGPSESLDAAISDASQRLIRDTATVKCNAEQQHRLLAHARAHARWLTHGLTRTVA